MWQREVLGESLRVGRGASGERQCFALCALEAALMEVLSWKAAL